MINEQSQSGRRGGMHRPNGQAKGMLNIADVTVSIYAVKVIKTIQYTVSMGRIGCKNKTMVF
jgi:hypothetical protein